MQGALGALLFGWYFPMPQGVHALVGLLNFLPIVQCLHCAVAFAFSCWYKPVSHGVHASSFVENSLPAGQNLHSYATAGENSWYFPAGHSRHEEASLFDAKPFSLHVWHVTEASSFDVWYLPPVHNSQVVVLLVNCFPAMQNVQIALTTVFSVWYLPASHDFWKIEKNYVLFNKT